MKVILEKETGRKRVIIRCLECKKLRPIKVVTGFGVWEKKCMKYKIGRNDESESCDNYE